MNHPPHQRRVRAARRLAAAATLSAGLAFAPQAVASRTTPPSPRDADQPRDRPRVYDATSAALAIPGWPNAGNTQITASRTWATAWSAADEALDDLAEARGKNRKGDAGARRVALARAVHDVLIKFVPGSKPKLDTQLFLTQQSAGRGAGVKLADRLGAAAAEKWVASRAFDGLDVDSVNAPFTPPAPGPGVWQPTPPAKAAAVQAASPRGARSSIRTCGSSWRPSRRRSIPTW